MSMPLTAHALLAQYRAGQATPAQTVETALADIAARDGEINAFLEVLGDRARAQAAKLAGQDPASLPLYGVPVAVKDNLCLAGVRTTCGSKMLHNFVPPYTATVLERIEAAGGILIGKCNMDEFAMGSSTENSAFKVTRNPRDTSRAPGGSSGGSAAAVAAGFAPLALGSDTGGSIRQPAAFCGTVGMKPTYGRVSRYGLVAFASSLDQIGPFAADVRDAALLLQVMAGHDPHDSTATTHPVADYVAACGRGVTGLRVGVPREYFIDGMQPEVASAVRAGIAALQQAGATVVGIGVCVEKSFQPGHRKLADEGYKVVALARVTGIQDGNLVVEDGTEG